MPRTILLVDGDQYLHRACAATERDVKWDDQNHILLSNEDEAYDTVVSSLKKITDRFGVPASDMVLTFSEGRCFRYDIDPTYKGNRVLSRKPLCFYDVRDRLIAQYVTVRFDGLEADDVMGILATKPGKDEKIIVARDKDMKCIPGKLWDGDKFKAITPAEADRFHLYQTLIGDAADGYPGCPGAGPVAAEAFLTEPFVFVPKEREVTRGKNKGTVVADWAKEPLGERSVWDGIVSHYLKAGKTAEDALKQARLARILRWQDWDTKRKEPILWTPPAIQN